MPERLECEVLQKVRYINTLTLYLYGASETSESLVVFAGRYDSRVKAMEVDERPTEQYGDIGGLDKQIQEVCQPI